MMDHELKVKYRAKRDEVYEKYGISKKIIDYFGEPLYIARAEKILSQKGVKPIWAGGGSNGCTFDITLEVISLSGNMPYKFAFKMDRISNRRYSSLPENTLEIVKMPSHNCEDILWQKDVGRDPGDCSHLIAGRLFLERKLESESRKLVKQGKIKEVFSLRKRYKTYKKPELFFVSEKYTEDVMDLFEYLEGTRMKVPKKIDIFCKYLKKKHENKLNHKFENGQILIDKWT